MRVVEAIESKINAELQPVRLKIEDESARHQGHAGARPEGESHFHVIIVSAKFEGMNQLARQRVIYRLLADEMKTDIHALSLPTLTPGEDS